MPVATAVRDSTSAVCVSADLRFEVLGRRLQRGRPECAGSPLQRMREAAGALGVVVDEQGLELGDIAGMRIGEKAGQSTVAGDAAAHRAQAGLDVEAGLLAQVFDEAVVVVAGWRRSDFPRRQREPRHRLTGRAGRQPAQECREKHIRIDRLRHVIVHAGVQAALPVARHDVRGHSDDGGLLVGSLRRADLA